MKLYTKYLKFFQNLQFEYMTHCQHYIAMQSNAEYTKYCPEMFDEMLETTQNLHRRNLTENLCIGSLSDTIINILFMQNKNTCHSFLPPAGTL